MIARKLNFYRDSGATVAFVRANRDIAIVKLDQLLTNHKAKPDAITVESGGSLALT